MANVHTEIRPIVFDWNNHIHVIEKRVIHRGTCESDDEEAEVCVICQKGAQQGTLGSDHLFLHPEDCLCLQCIRYAHKKADQLKKEQERRDKILF